MSAESAAVSRSAEFYSDPNNYGPITRLPRSGVVDVCVDPRLREGLSVTRGMVLAQTPGGLAGRGMDAAMFVGADLGQPAEIDTGIALARSWFPDDDALVHPDCKNNRGVVGILREMADPSGDTMDTMARWADVLRLPLKHEDTERVRRVALGLADLLGERTIEYVSEPGSGLPIYGVVGKNVSGVYVVSLASGVGLRHSNRPDGPEGEDMQGYVDIVAHSVDRALSVPELEHDGSLRRLLAAITIGRSAATKTALTGQQKDSMNFFEIHPVQGEAFQVERTDS